MTVLRGAARYVYLAVGCLFVALGVLGAFLPVLPTTPFLLISVWAFSRSSARLEAWLLGHRRFGPRLLAWKQHRVVPWPVKITAWVSMAVSLGLMIASGASRLAIGGMATVMVIGFLYVVRLPTRPPPPPSHDGTGAG